MPLPVALATLRGDLVGWCGAGVDEPSWRPSRSTGARVCLLALRAVCLGRLAGLVLTVFLPLLRCLGAGGASALALASMRPPMQT